MEYNLPRIRTVEDCEREFKDIIILTHYMNNYSDWDELYYKVYKALCACYEIEDCRNYLVKFRFSDEDDRVFSLPMKRMLLNLNLWRPLIEIFNIYEDKRREFNLLDETYIINEMFNDAIRIGVETKIVHDLNEYGIPFERSSVLLKEMIERFQEITVEFSLLTGIIFTAENCFLNDYMNSEKIRELNNMMISQDVQTTGVEDILKEKYKELVEEMGKLKNPIWQVVKAGNHIKDKQVQELFLNYGQVPDVHGRIIPYTMNGNGFSTGYNSPSAYYVAATGARLSSIMNKNNMGDAGYLSRNLVLLSRTLTLSDGMFDCGTKHLLKIKLTSPELGRRLENKWFCEHLGDDLECFNYHKHYKKLEGKTIYIRSLLTCAGGNEVCHLCYGKDSKLVLNMPGMAVFNTEIISAPVSQNILSTKHLLHTAAEEVKFGDTFNKYFKYTMGDVNLLEEDEKENDIDFSECVIRIPEDQLEQINPNDMMENSVFGSNVISPIFVYNINNKTYDKIVIDNVESIFLDQDIMQEFKLITDKQNGIKYYECPFSVISSEFEGRLFSLEVRNNGLTDTLYAIMNLLNRDASKYDDYNELAQTFFEMLIKGKIKCRIVQAEVMLNRLIRDANNLFERPDFSQFNIPEYKIVTLSQALLNMRAPTIGLSYQEIKRQLLSDSFYDEKYEASYLDALYSPIVSTNHFKEYHKMIMEAKKYER